MNLRPQGFKLSKAISGFIQYKAAEALSPTTLRSYEHDLKLWLEHAGDMEVGQVSAPDLRAYLVWLRTDYKPRRLTGGDHPLSPKTLRNIWVSLAAFFAWFSREFEVPNPMKSVPTPKFEEKPVEPFSKEDIEQVLKACDYCVEARTSDRRRFTMRRCTANRDHAMILTLLDTGLRASELCALKVGDLELKTGKLQVKHGVLCCAKGRKGRTVFLGKAARIFDGGGCRRGLGEIDVDCAEDTAQLLLLSSGTFGRCRSTLALAVSSHLGLLTTTGRALRSLDYA